MMGYGCLNIIVWQADSAFYLTFTIHNFSLSIHLYCLKGDIGVITIIKTQTRRDTGAYICRKIIFYNTYI